MARRRRTRINQGTAAGQEKFRKSLDPERVAAKNVRRAAPRQEFYYYVFGITFGGRKLIDGPFMSYAEADALMSTLESAEVFEKRTKDQAKATREIKAELLSRGEDPDKAIERVKHQQ